MESEIPIDIAIRIASSLSASDVCLLGCCSRFWRDVCSSEFIWFSLSKRRWPSFDLHKQTLDSCEADVIEDPTKEWRSFYIKWHKVMERRVMTIARTVKQCSQNMSLEVGSYLKTIGQLCSMEIGYMDVQLFLFTKNQNVLLNLIGLHYSLFWLGIPAMDVMDALSNSQISDRQVCIRWWKLGTWLNGFRMRDECHSRMVSLGSLAMDKGNEVIGILHRGTVHEVLRVQILVEPATSAWAC